jgi:hypothetical protein
MPKIIEMPRRTQPEKQDHAMHRSMIVPDPFEESESLAKIHRWLEMADSALENEPRKRNKTQIA